MIAEWHFVGTVEVWGHDGLWGHGSQYRATRVAEYQVVPRLSVAVGLGGELVGDAIDCTVG